MAGGALPALQADRDALLDVCAGLSDAEWKSGSGCSGWTVQDVVAHMGALFWLVVDPSTLPAAGDLSSERAQDLYVDSRRDWTAEHVVEDYRSVSGRAIEQLGLLLTQEFELPLGDLGTYPASMLPNAFAFDHYTHIRADLFAPRGPLTGTPPESDEMRLGPALDWIEAALPQQNRDALVGIDGGGTVAIRVEGTAGRTIDVGCGPTVATVTSAGPAFVRWITQRGSWPQLGVQAEGDEKALAVVRGLRVY